ncbi:ABC transporter permease [Avibacterium paragallinarum]|uniref:ABC transporter permease n=1 Tax=Avibacterium paragallinarum TaxID=728 RepID=UPI0039862823
MKNITEQLSEAIDDIRLSLKNNYFWRALAWNDILNRYRRSTLGPLWITLSMAITIGAMAPLYASFFGMPINDFFPRLALGIITWGLLASSINEFTNTFQESANYLKQIKISFSIFIFRVIYRQLIVFCHNLIIYPLVMLIFWKPININFLFVIPGIFLVTLNLFWIGLCLSIFCARFRDMSPIINSIVQLLFFITPVIWDPSMLSASKQLLVHLNFLATLLDLIRQPLLGVIPSTFYWVSALLTAIIGNGIALLIFAKKLKRNYLLVIINRG